MDNSNVNELLAKIAELEQALQAASIRSKGSLTYQVSDKGAVSVYGLQKFPVTLYAEQWARIDADVDNRKAFIAANKTKLATKPAKGSKPADSGEVGTQVDMS